MRDSAQGGWAEALQLHARAAAELTSTAEAVPAERWNTPLAPGKWSPAEVVQHLILAYEVLMRELAGGAGMALRTTWWQRLILDVTMRPLILSRGAFPRGARAPREVRPGVVDGSQQEAIARFRAAAAAFATAMEAAHEKRPSMRLTHAYFGARPLEEALRFCAVHIQHHRRQLLPLSQEAHVHR